MIVLSIYKPWILDLHSLHIHADQLGGEFWQLINPFRPSKLDDDVLALDIAEVVQARPQGLNPARRSSSRAETQAADARDSRRLLRARCERPRCYRAAKQRGRIPGDKTGSYESHQASAACPDPAAYERRGDAMRYLNEQGKIAWKASPRFLTMLADAERDARDDLAEFP
jgi:hypothetical protein